MPSPDRLPALSDTLRGLSKVVREDTLSQLKRVNPTFEAQVRQIAASAPGEIVRLVRDATEDAAEALDGGTGKLGGVAAAVAQLTHDPRDAREAAEALDAVARVLDRSPELRKVVGKALDVLEDRGVLGEGTLASVVSALGLLGTGALAVTRFAQGGALEVRLPQGSFSLDRTGKYAASLRVTDRNWTRAAVSIAVRGDVSGDPVSQVALRATVPVGKRTTVAPSVAVDPRSGNVRGDVMVTGRFGYAIPTVEIKKPEVRPSEALSRLGLRLTVEEEGRDYLRFRLSLSPSGG